MNRSGHSALALKGRGTSPIEESMRTLLLALMLVVSGCADAVAPEGEVITPPAAFDPVGEYKLVTLDAKPLPYDLAKSAANCTSQGITCVKSGALTIRRDGSFVWSFDWERFYGTGAIDQVGHFEEAGTWTAAGNVVAFKPTTGADTFTGSLTAAEVQFVKMTNGNLFVFRR